jgi:hypothetical protein
VRIAAKDSEKERGLKALFSFSRNKKEISPQGM